MLKTLTIKNIALIDDIGLELFSGLNILSGETGAGKSIIIDSLNFVLGERADRTLIRHSEKSASVEAVFVDFITPAVAGYLNDIGISDDDVLILRRVMTAEGKNECRINNRQVSLSTLKGLTALLADIHGQHEHQFLLNPDFHLELLDAYGRDAISPLKKAAARAYSHYKKLESEIASIGDSSERERKIDVLTYQIEEIKSASVKEGELDALLAERKRLQNLGVIGEGLGTAYDALNGASSYSALASLGQALNSLLRVSAFDEEIAALAERLEGAKIELKDISKSLKDIAGNLEYDERKEAAIEERIQKIRAILKKYGGTAEAVNRFLASAEVELNFLQNAEERVAALGKELEAASEALVIALSRLTKARKAAAQSFEGDVTKELKDLGMGNSRFSVSFAEISDDDVIKSAREDGCDSVEFLISPNIGEPLKPLAKIISGGEMSRFMLALKNITASLENIATMVFDEIDSGISGAMAEVVAQKLYNISAERQVVAVTHLPQLASMADASYLITKVVENGKTLTKLKVLDEAALVAEIARLSGGGDYSEFAEKHAKSMLAHAAEYKRLRRTNN
ncbi:MAG TPA: DNA repair protein RecN [Eubacteriales bacterium]|nr:DNA repair protein RecN [Eubacteriales bacterium]